jgi:hypothetical protein
MMSDALAAMLFAFCLGFIVGVTACAVVASIARGA